MNSPNNKRKVIEVGKFYFIHDGSKTGHPGLVISKNDEKNRYLVARFDSDKKGEIPKKKRGVKHITKLSHPTSLNVVNSYVHNRPMLCKRKNIGTKLERLSISKTDYQIINKVSEARPELNPALKK